MTFDLFDGDQDHDMTNEKASAIIIATIDNN